MEGKKIQGCILSDQIKSLDWKSRNIEFIEKANGEILEEVLIKFKTLID